MRLHRTRRAGGRPMGSRAWGHTTDRPYSACPICSGYPGGPASPASPGGAAPSARSPSRQRHQTTGDFFLVACFCRYCHGDRSRLRGSHERRGISAPKLLGRLHSSRYWAHARRLVSGHRRLGGLHARVHRAFPHSGPASKRPRCHWLWPCCRPVLGALGAPPTRWRDRSWGLCKRLASVLSGSTRYRHATSSAPISPLFP